MGITVAIRPVSLHSWLLNVGHTSVSAHIRIEEHGRLGWEARYYVGAIDKLVDPDGSHGGG